LAEIIAEFHYWDYGEYSRTAMIARPKIRKEELDKIAQEFNVNVALKTVVASYFTLNRIGLRIPNYRRIHRKIAFGRHPG